MRAERITPEKCFEIFSSFSSQTMIYAWNEGVLSKGKSVYVCLGKLMSDKSDAKNEKRKKSGGEGEKRERKSVNTAKAQRAPRESAMRLRASNVYFFHANNSFYSLSYLGRFGRPIIRTDQPRTEKKTPNRDATSNQRPRTAA